MLRDTYLRINLNRLENNVNEIKSYIKDDVIIGAVLKANGYGHGSIKLAEKLFQLDIDNFLVATLTEAIALKQANPLYKVLIMGHTPTQYFRHLIENDIVATIFSETQAVELNALAKAMNKDVKIHLKIDTGFNRLGFQITDELLPIITRIFALDHLVIDGAFTHLSLKDRDSDKIQIKDFNDLMAKLENRGMSLPIKHIMDSIGMVLYPDDHLNMVRLGAILYGLQSEERGILKVEQILSFRSKLSHIKRIKKGESISYGNRWVAQTDTNIGTIPFGYADGYPRNMYQKGYVSINQKQYPIVGVICMDQCMIDLGDDEYNDEEVIIIGDHEENALTIEDVARLANTNKNEIVSRFASRVPRIYIGG